MQVKRKNSEFKNIEFDDFTGSNETILASKKDFFFTKVAPVQSITDMRNQGNGGGHPKGKRDITRHMQVRT